MAKGSVRKKGKKWYGRFYIEDESGRKVQKEFAGTESKAETEAMLRKAIADYEEKQFVGKAENITVGDMLDMWDVSIAFFGYPVARITLFNPIIV